MSGTYERFVRLRRPYFGPERAAAVGTVEGALMFRHPLLRNFAFLFCLILSLSGSALAQAVGSLRGQVLDPAGAAVPGAAVTLTQGAMVRNTESGSDGAYSFKQLAPGSYS